MKSVYDIRFEDVAKNYKWERDENTLKEKGAVFIGYTDE